MKTLANLEAKVADLYKGKTAPEDIEALAQIKASIDACKKEAEASEKATTELAEKYRDALLKAGTFPPNGRENPEDEDEEKHVSFEECLSQMMKGK